MSNSISQLIKIENTEFLDFSGEREPLENRIFRILTQGKIRIGKLEDDISKILKEKIRLSIDSQLPITLIIGMGWGKNWKSYSAPHINWAEYFHFNFLYQCLGSISKIYKPGIKIEFTPDDLAVKIINGYKQEWLDIYQEEFLRLLTYFNSQTPANFQYTFNPSSNWYKFEELKEEICEVVEVIKKDNTLITGIINSRISNAKNNVVTIEGEDDIDYQKRLKESTLVHHAWIAVDYRHRQEYLEGGINIPIAHRKGIPGTYNLRNLKSSLVQFWKGDGIFRFGEKIYPNIISPKHHQEYLNLIKLIPTENPSNINSLNLVPVIGLASENLV